MRRSTRGKNVVDSPDDDNVPTDGKESESGGEGSTDGTQEEEISVKVAEVGDRYAIPSSCFEGRSGDGERDDVTRYAVVSRRERGTTLLWFDGDSQPTRYPGNMDDWGQYHVTINDCSEDMEAIFQELEVKAGVV